MPDQGEKSKSSAAARWQLGATKTAQLMGLVEAMGDFRRDLMGLIAGLPRGAVRCRLNATHGELGTLSERITDLLIDHGDAATLAPPAPWSREDGAQRALDEAAQLIDRAIRHIEAACDHLDYPRHLLDARIHLRNAGRLLDGGDSKDEPGPDSKNFSRGGTDAAFHDGASGRDGSRRGPSGGPSTKRARGGDA